MDASDPVAHCPKLPDVDWRLPWRSSADRLLQVILHVEVANQAVHLTNGAFRCGGLRTGWLFALGNRTRQHCRTADKVLVRRSLKGLRQR